jgi:hypothetical protein
MEASYTPGRRTWPLMQYSLGPPFAEDAHPLLDRHVFGVQADARHEARQSNQRFGELAELDAVVLPAEAGLDHHLFAVVRPALDEGRRREHHRLARLRLDPA